VIGLTVPLDAIPASLADWPLSLSEDRQTLTYTITAEEAEARGLAPLIRKLEAERIDFRTLDTRRSSLEDIFVDLLADNRGSARA
jgi:ABC-2 type transport system ATP-binding protein